MWCNRHFYPWPIRGAQLHRLSELAWHPSGNKLAFNVIDGNVNKVWQLDLRSGRATVFKNSTALTDITWGVDNILYEQTLVTYSWLDPNTGVESPFNVDAFVGFPRLAPDGRMIAVHLAEGSYKDKAGLWTISLVDSTQKLIFPGINLLFPLRWSPDGEYFYAYFLLQSPKKILKISADGSELLEIGSIPYSQPSTLDISPDGKYVIVPLPELQSDIWILENFDPDVGHN